VSLSPLSQFARKVCAFPMESRGGGGGRRRGSFRCLRQQPRSMHPGKKNLPVLHCLGVRCAGKPHCFRIDLVTVSGKRKIPHSSFRHKNTGVNPPFLWPFGKNVKGGGVWGGGGGVWGGVGGGGGGGGGGGVFLFMGCTKNEKQSVIFFISLSLYILSFAREPTMCCCPSVMPSFVLGQKEVKSTSVYLFISHWKDLIIRTRRRFGPSLLTPRRPLQEKKKTFEFCCPSASRKASIAPDTVKERESRAPARTPSIRNRGGDCRCISPEIGTR